MLDVVVFTDPACPFAFSAEPVRRRLQWHYGEHLRWSSRMIVLTRERDEAERLAEGAPGLQRKHGMPIDPRPYPRTASSEPACRAFVAARLHAPERAEALLRRLRVRVFQHGLLDDPELIAAAGADAGIDPGELAAWTAGDDVAAALEEDVAAARSPAPAARALDHKLSGPAGQRRYSAPSYVIGDWVVPGFNPIEAYETVIANLAPDLPRRPRPETVEPLLEWAADEPLATAEVAQIMGMGRASARTALREAGATWEPAGGDGYWAATGRPIVRSSSASSSVK